MISLQDTDIHKPKTWYEMSNVIIKLLKSKKYDPIMLDNCLIAHMIEELTLNDFINVINFIYSLDTWDKFQKLVKTYFTNNIINGKNNTKVIVFTDKGEANLNTVLALNDKIWSVAKETDRLDCKNGLQNLRKPKDDLAPLIGFISILDTDKNRKIFKNLEPFARRKSSGFSCSQAPKHKVIGLLNKILEPTISSDNQLIEKKIYNKDNSFNAALLCVEEEFILRIHNINKTLDKIWFLTPAESYYTIMKLH